jgi:hypothetical protein
MHFALSAVLTIRFSDVFSPSAVPKVKGNPAKVGPRISVIAWGRRRSLNERNSSAAQVIAKMIVTPLDVQMNRMQRAGNMAEISESV